MSYEFIKSYLRSQGYAVYPYEMLCGDIGCPHERNRFVDVVGHKDSTIYAFEYKSSGDYLLRAVKQVENYRMSFDYVIVIAQIPRHDISVNPTRGIRIKEILRLGAGLWTMRFMKVERDPQYPSIFYHTNPVFTVVVEPKLQQPNATNHKWVMTKFWRYRRSNRKRFGRPPDQHQHPLKEWTP